MNTMDTRGAQTTEFGAALELALDGRQLAWLGAEIARDLDLPAPITRSAVAQWVEGTTEPTRDKVFAAERVLGLKPGTLSRLLGYLPVEAKQAVSVLDAVDNDSRLSPDAKRILRAVYREATSGA